MKNLTNLKHFLVLSCLVAGNVAFGAASELPSEYDLKQQARKELSEDQNKLNSTIISILGLDTPRIAANLVERFLDEKLEVTGQKRNIILHNTSAAYNTTLLINFLSGRQREVALPAGESVLVGNTFNMRPVFGLKTESFLKGLSEVTPEKVSDILVKAGDKAEGLLGYDKYKPHNLNTVIRGRFGDTEELHIYLVNTGTGWTLSGSTVPHGADRLAPLAVVLRNTSGTYSIDVKFHLSGSREPLMTRIEPGQETQLAAKFSDLYPEISITKVPLTTAVVAAAVDYLGSWVSSSEGTTSTTDRFNIISALLNIEDLESADTLVTEVESSVGSQIAIKTSARMRGASSSSAL